MVPALLRDRVFRRYWSASTISMFGDQVSGVALPLAAVLALHAGAAQMGYLTALEWLPSLLFGLPAGAWVDRRGRRRRTMIAADLGRAALFASASRSRYALHALTLAQLFAVTFGAGVLSVAVQRVGRDAVRLDRGAGPVHGRAVADLRQPGAVVHRRPEHRRRAGAGCCPPRSRWPRTRCRSSARRSSWAGSGRPSRRPSDGDGSVTGGRAVHRRVRRWSARR